MSNNIELKALDKTLQFKSPTKKNKFLRYKIKIRLIDHNTIIERVDLTIRDYISSPFNTYMLLDLMIFDHYNNLKTKNKV